MIKLLIANVVLMCAAMAAIASLFVIDPLCGLLLVAISAVTEYHDVIIKKIAATLPFGETSIENALIVLVVIGLIFCFVWHPLLMAAICGTRFVVVRIGTSSLLPKKVARFFDL
ncbi:MAG: hypothetical protein ACJ8C4_05815 [Gemmataceae bacterium]